MDVRMPDGDGVVAAREITSKYPATKVVALTWLDDPGTVRDMLSAGAMGYVVKGGTMDELCSAIKRARSGEPELDQRVLPAAMEDLRRLLEEERERREEVERLSRARSEFVQILSHELRTPLTVITGTLKMFQAGGVPDEHASILESAVRRAEQLEFLVEGLELMEGGHVEEGVGYAFEAVRAAGDRLGTRPDAVDVTPEPWEGVPQRYLDRVTYELLSNAVRHGTPPVEASTRRENGIGILCVLDSGGWSADGEDFTAFFQRDMSETRAAGGFGLGLFVSSRLCQSCDGELSVREVAGRTVAEARFRLR
jgi:signal transduction histidine kinase